MPADKLAPASRSDAPPSASSAVALVVDGIRYHAEWRRPRVPGLPTLVFLHDGLGSVETLRRFPEAVADRLGLGAFAYDRWGYGRSDACAAFPPLFMEDSADRLEPILAAAAIDACVLVGHSDGGTVALLHAARYPARVRAVVTIAAHVRRDSLTYGQVLRHQKMVDERDIPAWMSRFHGDRAAHLLGEWARIWQLPLYDHWDITPEIAAIRAPLLALQGETDAYGRADQIERIGRAVAHAETGLIPGIGHFPHVEDPDGTADRVAGFIARHIPRGPTAART
ncbi:MAG: alpha/beta hydrolase [Alphaproteobacteria bacterium]|nr:alpha/beta hydrolase [Alphaproteobacteria bacterium]